MEAGEFGVSQQIRLADGDSLSPRRQTT